MDTEPDTEPDPTTVHTPAELIARLTELRRWAGNPSLRMLQRVGGRTESPGGDQVDALPPSTVSHVLTGKALPRAPKLAFVESFVTACLTAYGMPESEVAQRLPRWRSAWRAATDTRQTHRQLPMDIVEFTGRQAELRRLRELIDSGSPTAARVVSIEGMAGVGKTRFAVHAAHGLTGFGEIQLWIDLRGFDPHQGPLGPADVLETFLRLLDVPGSRIPTGLEERAALYRDRLAGRRAIVLLDNAASGEQVRPLLPGTADALVLITSRRDLSELDGLLKLPLDVLAPDEAVALLLRIAGREHLQLRPGEALEVATLCGFLPLAISLSARRLRSRPAWTLADLACRLRATGQPDQLTASFEVSYRGLPEPPRRLFRLLSLHPGIEFDSASSAALAELTATDAEALLESLVDEHLLQQESAGRYRFHDLLRHYAGQLAETDRESTRTAAVRRCLTWYLHTADAAWQGLEPARRRNFELPARSSDPRRFESYSDALAWFEAERHNLVAAARLAVSEGLTEIAWQLPAVLLRFFYLRSHWADWLDTHRAALAVTRQSGDRWGEARILNGLGIAHGDLRDFGNAIDCCTRASAIFEQLGDTSSQAWCLNNLGVTSIDIDQPANAVSYFERALALFQRSGNAPGEAIALSNLGDGHRLLGQPEAAIDCLHEALALQQRIGDRGGQRYTLGTLGDVHRDTGNHDQAIATYGQALAAYQESSDTRGMARILHRLGRVQASAGLAEQARERLRQAFDIFTALGDPEANDIEGDS